MTPYEMMLSESQERMLICVKKGAEDQVVELFHKYDLDAVTIGEVTDDGQYRLYHKGVEVANLPVDAWQKMHRLTTKNTRSRHGSKNLRQCQTLSQW